MPLWATAGLLPAFNIFVTERIRTIARQIGAPLVTKVPCAPNMVVLFTQHPQELLLDPCQGRWRLTWLSRRVADKAPRDHEPSYSSVVRHGHPSRDGILHSDSAQKNLPSELELYPPFTQEWMIALQRVIRIAAACR